MRKNNERRLFLSKETRARVSSYGPWPHRSVPITVENHRTGMIEDGHVWEFIQAHI